MRSREATIAAAARALGFSRAGTAPLAPLPVGPFLQAWLAEGRAGEMGYLARRTAERIDPRAARPWARAVISLAYPYRPPPPPPGDWRATLTGRIAAYALGEDYHARVGALLDALAARLAARRARPRLHDGPAPLPLVPNDRAPERDPGRAAPASRQLDLRLRPLPGGVPVERRRARRRRRRGAGAAPALAARARRGGLSRALREDGGGAREAARAAAQHSGGARQQREPRRAARPRRRARRSRAAGARARGVGARAPRRRVGAARPRGGTRERDGRWRGGGNRGGARPALTRRHRAATLRARPDMVARCSTLAPVKRTLLPSVAALLSNCGELGLRVTR